MDSQHSDVLVNSKGKKRERINEALAKLNRTLCSKCHKIRAKVLEDGVCTMCWKKENISDVIEKNERTTSLRLGPSAAWAFGLQEVEVVGEQIWLLGAKALAQNVQD